jgi:ATP-dependent exoDNAse (exonuclease V) alpha subunit
VPLDQAARFQVFRTKEIEFAPGDIVRVTHNGKTADDQHKLNNGSSYKIKRFDDAGNIVLDNGWFVGREFGHLAHGYVVTSHAAQGRTVDVALVGQSSASFPATSQEQSYVSWSRARERTVIYTDDREALREAIGQSDDRMTATELVASGPVLSRVPQRQVEVAAPLEREPREERGYERESA